MAARGKARIAALKDKVQAKIDQELKSPKHLMQLNKEVAYEEHKQKAAARRAKKPKAAAVGPEVELKSIAPVLPRAKDGSGSITDLQQDENLVSITTVLLVIRNAAPVTPQAKTPRKNQYFAMTLWADGLSLTPNKLLDESDLFIIREYNAAYELGAHEAGCSFCRNTCKLTEAKHAAHVAWHKKFRQYFIVRRMHYPQLVDYDSKKSWTTEEQEEVMTVLMEVWKSIDPDAPWFKTPQYLKDQPAAKRAAEAALSTARELHMRVSSAARAAKEATIGHCSGSVFRIRL